MTSSCLCKDAEGTVAPLPVQAIEDSEDDPANAVEADHRLSAPAAFAGLLGTPPSPGVIARTPAGVQFLGGLKRGSSWWAVSNSFAASAGWPFLRSASPIW